MFFFETFRQRWVTVTTTGNPFHRDYVPHGRRSSYESDYLTDYLQKIRESVKYKKWFFGHMHINEDFKEENAVGIYEQIIRIA